MAKGLRSNAKQRNKSILRSSVFAPAYDKRTERISAKLQELANQPKEAPAESAENEGDQPKEEKTAEEGAMDIDKEASSASSATSSSWLKTKRSGRIQKRVHRKPQNCISFKPNPAKVKRLARSKK